MNLIAILCAIALSFSYGTSHAQINNLPDSSAFHSQSELEQTGNLAVQISTIAQNNRAPYLVTFGKEKYTLFQEMLTTGLDKEKDKALAARIQDEGLTIYREPKPSFTYTEAVQDLDFLFEYLKYGYSGYGYFGGDTVFIPLKDEIKAKLQAIPDGQLSSEVYRDILGRALVQVISDGHFSLGGLQLLQANVYCYLSKDLLFGKDEQGYYLLPNGTAASNTSIPEKSYFAGVNGIQSLQDAGLLQEVADALKQGNYDTFIKPTLDQNGYPAYTICMSSIKEHDSIETEIKLKNAESTKVQKIQLTRVKFENYLDEMNRNFFEDNQIYRTYEKDGVKIVEMRAFYSPSDDPAPLEQFVADAESLRTEDYVILDLRRNGGGNSKYAVEWFCKFAQTEDYGLGAGSTLLTQTVRATIPEDYGVEAFQDFDNRCGRNTVPGWDLPAVTEPSKPISRTPNQTKLFVITDLGIASAGENFIAFLQRLDNVYFVGTNTWGVSTFGNMRSVYLPNTALEVNASYNINILPDLKRFEGVGYQPDFWVDTNDCIPTVLKLIDNLKKQS